MMKRIIYFIAIVLMMPALYSCSGQYDNIDKYATDETVYVGKYADIDPGAVQIGYNRIEIDLLDESMGRANEYEIYMGKAKRTIIEYEEANVMVRRTIDSVCSWLNITGLTSPKTYIIKIYTEDGHGNQSVAVEALGKPFTDADLAGISFPIPSMTPTPTTVEFRWSEESGLTSSLFKFVGLDYSYIDSKGDTITGKLTSQGRTFSAVDLPWGKNVPISVNCKIIPIMESGRIIDTVAMVGEFIAKTVTKEEYLRSRTLQPVMSAMVSTSNPSEATIVLGQITEHLEWTEIRYMKSDGTLKTEHRPKNDPSPIICSDIKRGEKFQIRCAYIPPETSEVLVTEWEDYSTFMVKYDMKEWVVLPKNGSHAWGDDGVGSQDLWDGGHPMLILDDDQRSGWHSPVPDSHFPQMLIIDMKGQRKVTAIRLSNNDNVNHGYWNHVNLYLTDILSMSGYVTHNVDWSASEESRVLAYQTWMNSMMSKIPENPPASWGSPIVQQSNRSLSLNFLLPQLRVGSYLIVMFPDATNSYVCINDLEVYSD